MTIAKARSSALLPRAATIGKAEFCATRRTGLSVAARGRRRRSSPVLPPAKATASTSQPATSAGDALSRPANAAQAVSKIGAVPLARGPEAREVDQQADADAGGGFLRQVGRQLSPGAFGPRGAGDVEMQPGAAVDEVGQEPRRCD